jgi:predicted glycoside hydrolase/deacetylase ChbG (UPF0249 family)
MNRSLIVNADDYCRSHEINTGIHEAHLAGIVTTTTVLINLPDALQTLMQGVQKTPTLGFGLHLNLTLGKPCRKETASSALVDSQGHFHPVSRWYAEHSDIPISLIRAEWYAQVETMLSAGVTLDHLDSHHHIATIRADIWQCYLDLAQELNCGVRPPFPNDISTEKMHESFPVFMIDTAKRFALPALKQSHVQHPNNFLASFFDKNATLQHLLNLIEDLPPGISEIMCHPGYSSPKLEKTSRYARQRTHELAILTDDQTTQMVKTQDIQLVTYQQAWPKQ